MLLVVIVGKGYDWGRISFSVGPCYSKCVFTFFVDVRQKFQKIAKFEVTFRNLSKIIKISYMSDYLIPFWKVWRIYFVTKKDFE